MKSTLDYARATALAKELQRSARSIGTLLPLASFYEAIAHGHGYKDWNSCKPQLVVQANEPLKDLSVACAAVSWRGGAFVHSIAFSEGLGDLVSGLVAQVQSRSKPRFDGLLAAFTRPDVDGLPRLTLPPKMWARELGMQDAWDRRVEQVPQIGDCIPFRVEFRRERGGLPEATVLLWFLRSSVSGHGFDPEELPWRFGELGVWMSSSIYRFIEPLTGLEIPRRSAILFNPEGSITDPSMWRCVEDRGAVEELAYERGSTMLEEQVETLNRAEGISRLDAEDISRAFNFDSHFGGGDYFGGDDSD